MRRITIVCFRIIALVGFLAGSSVVEALEIEPGVGAGLLYTDNAALTASNEEDDLAVVGYAGTSITEDSGSLQIDATAEVFYLDYTEDTFSDQTYPVIRANADWEQIKNRLEWNVQNYFTQQRTNAVDGVTPDNIQNTNVFSLASAIRFPLSARHLITVTPGFDDFYYEDFGADNQQYTLSVDWLYRMYRTIDVSLDGRVTRADYESDEDAQDYTGTQIHAGISGTRARSDYSVNLGATRVNRENSSNEEGFTGDFTLNYQITGRSSARAHVASNITDTGNILLNSQADPDNGGFQNIQTSNNVVRDSVMRLTYIYETSLFNGYVYGELRDLDYKESPEDRDVRDVGADLNYTITQRLATGISGTYSRVKQTDNDVRDTRYSITGRLGYRLSSKLRADFDLRYQDQSGNSNSVSEYSEFSTFVSLVYGFARVSRPAGGGSYGSRGGGASTLGGGSRL